MRICHQKRSGSDLHHLSLTLTKSYEFIKKLITTLNIMSLLQAKIAWKINEILHSDILCAWSIRSIKMFPQYTGY